MTITVGQIYRDKYWDGKDATKTFRTIRIVEVFGDKARAETVTNIFGGVPTSKRTTHISAKTLAACYEQKEG